MKCSPVIRLALESLTLVFVWMILSPSQSAVSRFFLFSFHYIASGVVIGKLKTLDYKCEREIEARFSRSCSSIKLIP